MAIRTRTFGDLWQSVMEHVKEPTDNDESVTIVKAAINRRYTDLVKEKKYRWRSVTRALPVPARYNTGTASLTNNDRYVTLVGTAVDDTYVGWRFKNTAYDEVYRVIGVDTSGSNPILVLDGNYQGTTATGQTYYLFKSEFGLFPDYADIGYVKHAFQSDPVIGKSSDEIEQMRSYYPNYIGKAKFFTVDGLTLSDAPVLDDMVLDDEWLVDDDENYHQIRIFPEITTEQYILQVKYYIDVYGMEDDDEEPIIPINNRIAIFKGGVSDWFAHARNETEAKRYDDEYKIEVSKMEGDVDITDNTAQIVIPDMYRRFDLRGARIDYGQRFDRIEHVRR